MKYFVKITRSIFKLKFRYIIIKAVFEKERFHYNAFVLKKSEAGFFSLFSAFSARSRILSDPPLAALLYLYICVYIYIYTYSLYTQRSFLSIRFVDDLQPA